MIFKKERVFDKTYKSERLQVLDKEKTFLRAKIDFISKFNEIMYELGLYNKFNKTYKLDIKEEKNYGYTASISLATGLNFKHLDLHIDTIQQNLECLLIVDYQNNKNTASVKIITKPIDTTIKFKSPNIKANEMYLGMSYSLEPVIVDCNRKCMFLLAGTTGAGKTRLIYMVLLSWVLSKENKIIELYIGDAAKREFVNFQDVKSVRGYADNLEELKDMAQYLYLKISYRVNTLEYCKKKGLATNIEEYNKLTGVEKMSYNYLLIDEFSILMPEKSDTNKEKKIKEDIIFYLKKISKLGRAFGLFVIFCTQKTTKDEIPAIIKNMSAVRVSLRANDAISSEVILGNDAAVGLADRLAIYSLNGGSKQDYLFAPDLTSEYMNDILKPYTDSNFPKLNFKLLIKEMEDFEKNRLINKNKTSNHLPIQNKSIEKKVVENLPYDIILHDLKNLKESKNIDFSKTEKPRKKINEESKNGWWLLK